MKKKSESILPSCALCIHAKLTRNECLSQRPPALLSLNSDGMDGEMQFFCPYHKNVDPGFSCRRFSFDPLKYRPRQAPKIGSLDKDALLLD